MQGPINRTAYMQEIQSLSQDYLQTPAYQTVKKIADLAQVILHDHTVYGRPEEFTKYSWRNDEARDE